MNANAVEVALPIILDKSFTYLVPSGAGEAFPPGSRVLVSFGQRVLYGIVRPEAARIREDVKYKEILARADDDDLPSLPEDVVQLCEWLANYYVAPIGEAYRLALPGMLTSSDARTIRIGSAAQRVLEHENLGPLLSSDLASTLTPEDRKILALLAAQTQTTIPLSRAVSKLRKIPAIYSKLEQLAKRGLCEIEWSADGPSEDRKELHLRRSDVLRGIDGSEAEISALVGRSKQRRALLDVLETQTPGEWIAVSELRSAFPRVRELSRGLIEHRLVEACERALIPDLFDPSSVPTRTPDIRLSAEQTQALDVLIAGLEKHEFSSFLLHGITGSGKTEVYLRLIERALELGGGAIVLVPEIALTPQLAGRFRAKFGAQVAVLHSALSDRQRLDAWYQLRSGRVKIAIGARSAIFAPVQNLRIVVVDEEHDASFKQDESVRYHGRDVALVRARLSRALAVLGSATPALESLYLAEQGRHTRLRLTQRPTPRPLPTIELLALTQHRPDPDTMMSARLRDALRETVAAKEQAILFLNRRGYTTMLRCTACGLAPQCPDCSGPSLTYHRQRHRLMCHLCGHIEDVAKVCPSCGEPALRHLGGGTERVEAAIAEALPNLRVLRLDRDTSRGRRLLEVLTQFRRGEADVLVGTQMLSKGHDFPGVTLVGVLQADHGLGLPDPRSAERVFQLLTQVAGRAGRGERPGRVIIQAWSTDVHPLPFAKNHDYDAFAKSELAAREELENPPYGHLALLRVSGADGRDVQRRIENLRVELASWIAKIDIDSAVMILGPVPSPVERINQKIRWQLLLRAGERKYLRWVLTQIRGRLGLDGPTRSQTLAVIDVDPYHFM